MDRNSLRCTHEAFLLFPPPPPPAPFLSIAAPSSDALTNNSQFENLGIFSPAHMQLRQLACLTGGCTIKSDVCSRVGQKFLAYVAGYLERSQWHQSADF